MKKIIVLITLCTSLSGYALETKLEGRYEAKKDSKKCTTNFEVVVQNNCLVLEGNTAEAKEFCHLNQGPRVVSKEVEVLGANNTKIKMLEYTTTVETLIGTVFTVSETKALKNFYGMTFKRTNLVASYSGTYDGLVYREGVTVYEALKAPKFKARTCQYKIQ